MGYSTYFYEQAGLPTVQAFNMSMAQVSHRTVSQIHIPINHL